MNILISKFQGNAILFQNKMCRKKHFPKLGNLHVSCRLRNVSYRRINLIYQGLVLTILKMDKYINGS